MIVRMHKLAILCSSASRGETVARLQDLGVVHVRHMEEPGGGELETLRQQIAQVRRVLAAVPAGDADPTGTPPYAAAALLLSLLEEKDAIASVCESLEAEIRRVEPFGPFDPHALHELAAKGVRIRLFTMSVKKDLTGAEEGLMEVIHRGKETVYFALLGDAAPPEGADAFALPDASLQTMKEELAGLERMTDSIDGMIASHTGDRAGLAALLDNLEDRCRYLESREGMHVSAPVCCLEGFCPQEDTPRIVSEAEAQGWGIVYDEPGPDDDVPTCIRNPRWVRLIKPIMDFIGILPGYREVDINPLFLVFFSIFFGMIVGDAGYGALFLAVALAGGKLFPKAPRILFSMLTLMSLSTITWGALTGSYFGMLPEHLPAPLHGHHLLSNANPEAPNNIMWICFLIGAIHLTIAHGWNVIRKWPSMEAVGDLGWLMTTWVMFFGARTMILLKPFPSFMMWVLAVGAGLVALSLIFPLAKLKERGINLIVLPLNLVSNFVDVVSYVRLFAVGMATFAVASAFNQMAGDIGFNGVVASIGSALILFVGHALNIALAVMGVLVHGIRLNTLEFSGHLGMEWTGFAYAPLTRKAGQTEKE